MSELIQKLAEQARKYADENRPGSFVKYDPEWFVLYNEKFAVLIVKECISELRDAFDMTIEEGNHLKEHFGVKE